MRVVLGSCLLLAMAGAGLPAAGAVTDATGSFGPIYDLLRAHCGDCHVRGQADGPWSLDTPPSATRYPDCLREPGNLQLQCAAYHQLVDPPAPGIPAWIRPAAPAESEPYAQACDPAVSFHIGHSLPEPLPAADCARFLDWIESGASR